MKKMSILFSFLFIIYVIIISNSFVKAFEILPDPDICCNLSIYAYSDSDESNSSSSTKNLGHAFLTFENLTSSTYLIGDYTIKSHESISVGTWPQSITGYSGVCYNFETYYMNVENHSSTVYLKTSLTYSDLSTLNNVIKLSDNWELFNNCSSFATKVWNSVSNTQVNAGMVNTPSNLIDSIKKYNYYTGCSITYNSNIGYFKNGVFIKVEKSI